MIGAADAASSGASSAARGLLGGAQLGDPRLVVAPHRRAVGERPQRGGEVADHGQHVDVGGPLRLGVDDVGHVAAAEAAEPEAEVERRAEHDDDVGAAA